MLRNAPAGMGRLRFEASRQEIAAVLAYATLRRGYVVFGLLVHKIERTCLQEIAAYLAHATLRRGYVVFGSHVRGILFGLM